MDNVSKAVLFAGAILIAVGLISLTILVFQSFKDYNGLNREAQVTQETLNFNRFFVESYYSVDGTYTANGARISGFDVYNILAKIENINNDATRFYDIDYSSSSNMTKVNKILQIINKYKTKNHVQSLKGRKIDDADLATLRSKDYFYRYEINNSEGYVRKVIIK